MLLWFPPIFLSGSTRPVAILSLWHMLLQSPNPNFPGGEQNIQFSEFSDLIPFSECLQATLSLNSSPLKQHTRTALQDSPQLQKLGKFIYETSYV